MAHHVDTPKGPASALEPAEQDNQRQHYFDAHKLALPSHAFRGSYSLPHRTIPLIGTEVERPPNDWGLDLPEAIFHQSALAKPTDANLFLMHVVQTRCRWRFFAMEKDSRFHAATLRWLANWKSPMHPATCRFSAIRLERILLGWAPLDDANTYPTVDHALLWAQTHPGNPDHWFHTYAEAHRDSYDLGSIPAVLSRQPAPAPPLAVEEKEPSNNTPHRPRPQRPVIIDEKQESQDRPSAHKRKPKPQSVTTVKQNDAETAPIVPSDTGIPPDYIAVSATHALLYPFSSILSLLQFEPLCSFHKPSFSQNTPSFSPFFQFAILSPLRTTRFT